MPYEMTFAQYVAALVAAKVPIDVNSERVQAFKRFMDDTTLTVNPMVTPTDRANATKYMGQTFNFKANYEGKVREVTVRYSLTPDWIPEYDNRKLYMHTSNSWSYGVNGSHGGTVYAANPIEAVEAVKKYLEEQMALPRY